MPSSISAEHLRREPTPPSPSGSPTLTPTAAPPRDAITALAAAALDAAEDAARWLRVWLVDGWSGNPDQIPATGPSYEDRDRMLLAGMTAACNAVTLAGAVRIRQDIDRPMG